MEISKEMKQFITTRNQLIARSLGFIQDSDKNHLFYKEKEDGLVLYINFNEKTSHGDYKGGIYGRKDAQFVHISELTGFPEVSEFIRRRNLPNKQLKDILITEEGITREDIEKVEKVIEAELDKTKPKLEKKVQEVKEVISKENVVSLTVEELYGIPSHFVVWFVDKKSGRKQPYVTKAGLLYKMEKIYGIGNFAIEVRHHAYSFENDNQLAHVTAQVLVWSGDKSRFFKAESVTTKDNCNPKLHSNLDQLAETRAVCRALRWATACGLTAIEERMGEVENEI